MDITTLITVLVWSGFVGVVFSAIGAAGGILTSFGLITLFGLTDPTTVKPMTQLVVLATALVFVPGYLRRGALVWPLGLLLGLGGLVGAYAGSTLSSLYLADMQTFRPLFGLLTLAVAAQIALKLVSLWRGAGEGTANRPAATGKVTEIGLDGGTLRFWHAGTGYRVPVWSPLLAGAVIAMTAAVFGVGGGFLLVPYMASVLSMPMHIIPATAAIAIFMSLAVSIGNFLAMGAAVDTALLVPLMIGTVAGAILGPRVNAVMRNDLLLAAMGIVVAGIGIRYTWF